MRFYADGPSIPDALLEQCDQGKVVFLCGAGISEPSGLPSFKELAKEVVNRLDPDKDSPITKAFAVKADGELGSPKESLDQIFELLHQEYGREEVNEIVAEFLCEEASTESGRKEHSLIARISSDPDGNPQIVTTNFDLLFEKYLANPQLYTSSNLDQVFLNTSINGVVYLHGRLQDPCVPPETGKRAHDYTLSSSDFGQAYLSEGWATRFIKKLLEKRTVVMVGYQAGDLPVRYLLQGISQGEGDGVDLYAFAQGSREEVDRTWRGLGVTAIAYDHFRNHQNLWDTIEAWAERADNPESWRSGVVRLAERGPRALAPHERGQVAHLVRTTHGARLFSTHKPHLTAEWLCVFDASCRIARKGTPAALTNEEFYPLKAYILDDDEVNFRGPRKQAFSIYDHLLGWRKGDEPTAKNDESEVWEVGRRDMPLRLRHLMGWVIRSADSPITAWWVARKYDIHSSHLVAMRRVLGKNDNLHPEALQTWDLIRKMITDQRHYSLDVSWFDFLNKRKKLGWGEVALQALEDAARPKLIRNTPYDFDGSMPPLGTWDDAASRECIGWEIKYQRFYRGFPNVSGEVLDVAFKSVEKGIRIAIDLHQAIGTDDKQFDTLDCYPSGDGIGPRQGRDAYFREFLVLIDKMRMRERHCKLLKSRALAWNEKDRFFFSKLKLYALNGDKPFSAAEAADIVLKFDPDTLWDRKTSYELLRLLVDRRREFGPEVRGNLVDRLLSGAKDQQLRLKAASYVTWIRSKGFPLSRAQARRLKEITSEIPDWQEERATVIVEHRGIRTYAIRTDTSPQCLRGVPVSEIVERAKAETREDLRLRTAFEPFVGLVDNDPRTALIALLHAAKSGDYPIDFWHNMMLGWPRDIEPFLTHVSLRRIARFHVETIQELGHVIGFWLGNRFRGLYASNRELAWSFSDAIITGLLTNTDTELSSSPMAMEKTEPVQKRIRQAIDSPIGTITKGWLDTLRLQQFPAGQMPGDFVERLDRLVSIEGKGRNYAIAAIAREIYWLYDLDPAWVSKRMMSWFDFDHPATEFAWNGFLFSGESLPRGIRKEMKPLLLDLFPRINQWPWDGEAPASAVKIILELSILREGEPGRLTEKEARHCLRKMRDEDRQTAISYLSKIGENEEDGWNRLVPEFIEEVWPRDMKLVKPQLVSAWVELLSNAGDDFPRILGCVKRFLDFTDDVDYWDRFAEKDGDKNSLASRYPEAVLDLLSAVVPDEHQSAPDELGRILKTIRSANRNLAKKDRFVRLLDIVRS